MEKKTTRDTDDSAGERALKRVKREGVKEEEKRSSSSSRSLSPSSSDSGSDDEDIEQEQERLRKIQESRRIQAEMTNGESFTTKSTDYDVLFRKRPAKKTNQEGVRHNNKQESESYKQFMKKLFK